MKILIVEDELSLSESITAYLKAEDYTCEVAFDLRSAISKIRAHDYACILLDITLPNGSGLEILKEIKDNNKMDGVLIMSAKDSLTDKLLGLNLGADDYLAKPFHLAELNARIAAIIRRRNFGGDVFLKYNDISIDTRSKLATVCNITLELTKKEYELLLYFVSNKHRVISKNAIIAHLWNDEVNGDCDFIYTHIKNLRKKLKANSGISYIKSVYGMGYKFIDK